MNDMRDALEAIVIRCKEGDKKFDWLETILDIAERALASQPSPAATVETPPRAWLEAKAEVDAGWPERCSAGNVDEREALAKVIQSHVMMRSRGGRSMEIFGFEEAADAILRMRVEPQSSGMWQPIETAPKDGARFLATGGGLDDAIEVASYNERVGAWNTENYTLDDRDDDAEGYNRPSHWQPMPSPMTRPQSGSGE